MDFKVYTGAWSKVSDGTLTDIVDTTLSATVITGSENDKDYTFEANVVVKQESGWVIVNHTVDKNYDEGSFAVYGYVNGLLMVETDDLLEVWGRGQKGFKSLGEAGNTQQSKTLSEYYA